MWQGEPLHELIGSENIYDWIIASHVIEHVPDFISFLIQCEKLLCEKGYLSLVVPDKRHCFDLLTPISSTGSVLDAFYEKRTRPSVGLVFDHFANACHINNQITWLDHTSGEIKLIHEFHQAKELSSHALNTKEYLDVHCWRFIPESFELIINDLRNLSLTSLKIVKSYPTAGFEFFITLQKDNNIKSTEKERLNYLKKIMIEKNTI